MSYCQQVTTNSQLRLYVAGIPTRVSERRVVEYFSQFGPIDYAEMRFCGTKNNKSLPLKFQSKGYCIVKAGTLQTVRNILQSQEHNFGGRKLHVSEFRTGMDLILHNHRSAKKRVLLKKVPSTLSEPEITALLEELVQGKVEAIFRYEPEGRKHKVQKHRKISTYSVIFECRKHRDQLVELGEIPLGDGRVITVEKFKHANELVHQATACQPVEQTSNSSLQILSSQDDFDGRNHHTSTLDFTPKNSVQELLRLRKAQSDMVGKVASRPSLELHLKANSSQHSQDDRHDHSKPTHKEYHSSRRLELPAHSKENFNFEYTSVHDNNLRFNLSKVPVEHFSLEDIQCTRLNPVHSTVQRAPSVLYHTEPLTTTSELTPSLKKHRSHIIVSCHHL